MEYVSRNWDTVHVPMYTVHVPMYMRVARLSLSELGTFLFILDTCKTTAILTCMNHLFFE